MFRLLLVLAGLVLAVPAASQQPPPVARFPGGFGGVSPDQFRRSAAALAAGQLSAELAAVRAEVGRSAAPPPLRAELTRLSDAAARRADELRRLAAAGAGRDRLIVADRATDQAVEALLAAIGRGVVPSPGLSDAIARAQYADQQLHEALGTGDGGGPDPAAAARLAEAVSAETERLRDLGANAPPGVPFDRTLDRGLRSFAHRADRLRQTLVGGGTAGQAARDYEAAAAVWRALRPSVTETGTAYPAFRVQAARVGGLFRSLGERLQVGGDPDPPGPGFLGRGMFAAGAGEGGGPRVRVFAGLTGQSVADFFAFDPDFRGGVRVAVADLNGDGTPDLVCGPGAGMPPVVRVFDGRTLRLASEFLAYDAVWTGGLFVAAADRTRAGRAVVVTGADVGAGPHVKAFDVTTGRELDSFMAYADAYRGGVRVALGDVDGDGLPDVVTAPGARHDPRVRVFSGANRQVIADFFAYDKAWLGGLYVAAADLTKNGRADVIVGTDVGGPGLARVFDAVRGRRLGEVSPFPRGFRGGVRVAAHDFDGDGVPDVVCAPGPDDRLTPRVRVFSGTDSKPLGEFPAFEPTFHGGVFVGAK